MGKWGRTIRSILMINVCILLFCGIWQEKQMTNICFAKENTKSTGDSSESPIGKVDEDPTSFSPKLIQKKKAQKVDINNDGKKERVRFFVKKTKKGKYKITLYVNKKLRFKRTCEEKNWVMLVGNQGRVLLIAGGQKEGSPCTQILCYEYKKKKMHFQQDVLKEVIEQTTYVTWKDKYLVQGKYPVILNEDGSLTVNLSLTSASLKELQSQVTLSFDEKNKKYLDDSTNVMELTKSIGEVTVKKECKLYSYPNIGSGQIIPANAGEKIKLIGLFIKNKDAAFVKVKIRQTIAYIEFNQFVFEEYFQ